MKWLRRKLKTPGRWKQWLKAAGWALLILLIIRNFIFHWTVVESTSMSKTLLPGDLVMVNHLNYGPRFPGSVVAVPFTDWYANVALPYWRIPGFGEPTAGDLIVFNDPSEQDAPYDRKTQQVKRLIALPGDTVVITNDLVSVNGENEHGFGYQSFNFLVEFQDGETASSLIDSFRINEGQAMPDGKHFILNLDSTAFYHLSNHNAVKDIQHWKDDTPDIATLIYAPGQNQGWNLHYFGPYVVPAKGQTISLNETNRSHYADLIQSHEEETFTLNDDGTCTLDGATVTEYTFQYDYYFVLGDNRHNSTDSRFWGPVPESHIVGNVSFILFSSGPEGVRWNRFFSAP